ncbi:hypothetical protein [uncultured Robinsoniella sp.]|uniref:hypothetical protein n=1 Tax=uncultured Robinsoniella sp. TaxID=904190 RepID=UPI00374E908D
MLDPILIFSCNMGVAGAAAATLFSQIVSSALYVCFLVRGKSYLKISLGRFKHDKVVYTEVLKIGFPVCMFQFLTGGALSICRQGLFFIPFLFLFTNLWGLTGLILAQLAADLCATFVTVVLWRKEKGIR